MSTKLFSDLYLAKFLDTQQNCLFRVSVKRKWRERLSQCKNKDVILTTSNFSKWISNSFLSS